MRTRDKVGLLALCITAASALGNGCRDFSSEVENGAAAQGGGGGSAGSSAGAMSAQAGATGYGGSPDGGTASATAGGDAGSDAGGAAAGSSGGAPSSHEVILFSSNALLAAGGAGGAAPTGDYEIWSMDVDGQNRAQLTDNDTYDADAQLSPDGSKIAWEVSPGDEWDTSTRDIWVMNVDGSEPKNLTMGNGVGDAEPAWSPDGKVLVYNSRPNSPEVTQLYFIPIDGSMSGSVWVDDPASANHPQWRGNSVVYDSNRNGNLDIWLKSDSDNDKGINVTVSVKTNDSHPALSPDGTRIAFAAKRDGDREIYVMNLEGTNATQLTSNTADDFWPSWSPDGTKIAFSSDLDGTLDIWVMDANGANQVNLTPDQSQSIESSASWGVMQ